MINNSIRNKIVAMICQILTRRICIFEVTIILKNIKHKALIDPMYRSQPTFNVIPHKESGSAKLQKIEMAMVTIDNPSENKASFTVKKYL